MAAARCRRTARGVLPVCVLLCSLGAGVDAQVCAGGPVPATIPAGTTTANFANCNALSNGAACQPATGYTCLAGYTPDPTTPLTLNCAGAGNTYDASAARCNAHQCTGGVIPPNGASLVNTGTLPAVIATGVNLATWVQVRAGYSCTGAPTALCAVAGGNQVTVPTFTCVGLQCNSISAVTGATINNQGQIRTGDVVTLTPAAGFACTGTGTALCPVAGGVANVQGFSCTQVCNGISAPAGALVIGSVPNAISNGMDISAFLQAANGFVCTGAAVASCTNPPNAATVGGYTCTAMTCTSMQAPSGARITAPQTVTNGQVVTGLLAPQDASWTCSGTATAVCNTQSGVATVSGYACTRIQCTSFVGPTGSTVTNQGVVTTGQNVAGRIAAIAGWTCTGTPVISCPANGQVASVTGYTCTQIQCTSFTSPTGSTVTNQGAVTNGQNVAGRVAAIAGWTCVGTPLISCPVGGQVGTITGYTCTQIQCTSFTSPAGSTVTNQGAVTNGQNVAGRVASAAGWTCVGTPLISCPVGGQVATITGYTCTQIQCTSFTSPAGSTVTNQGAVTNGQNVAGRVAAIAGWTCVGTPLINCPANGQVATITGYTCTQIQCTSFTSPAGSTVTNQGAVTNGQNVAGRVAAIAGWTCVGTPLISCPVGGQVGTITGYTCTQTQCNSFTSPAGSTVTNQGAVSNGQNVAGRVAAIAGWTCVGTPTISCGGGGQVGTVVGFTCTQNQIQCTSFTSPAGSTVTSQGAVTNGQNVAGRVTAIAGWTCVGTPIISCAGAGQVGIITGYSCTSQQCTSFTSPAGSTVTNQGAVSNGQSVAGRVAAIAGWTCVGNPIISCPGGAQVATITGYSCSTQQCTSFTSPAGSTVTNQGAVSNGQNVAGRVAAIGGWTCVGTPIISCPGGAQVATITGYSCTSQQCTSFTSPAGSTITSQGPVSNGQNVAGRVAAISGWTCVGTPIISCPGGAQVATITGYSCSTNAFTCPSFVGPAGSIVVTQGGVNNGQDVSGRLSAQQGWTCVGRPIISCLTAGATASVTGYSCTQAGFTCSSITPPTGAVVVTQGGVNNGQDVTSRLSSQSGFTCAGTGIAQCPTNGAAATVSGYVCSPVSVGCTSLVAPFGTRVVTQGSVVAGTDVTSRLVALPSYVCTGRAIALCTSASPVAVATGYTCVANPVFTCTGGINVPTGSQLSGVALPPSIKSGDDVTQYLTPLSNNVCYGRAIAYCPANGPGRVDVAVGYGCSTRTCQLPPSQVGYVIAASGITCAVGYAGSPMVSCPAGTNLYVLSGCVPLAPNPVLCTGTPFGYVVGSSCLAGASCTNVLCAAGWVSSGNPRVVCDRAGGVLGGFGCTAGGTPAPPAGCSAVQVPERAWERLRIRVQSPAVLGTNAEKVMFSLALESKLKLANARFERGFAELRVVLLCPVGYTNACAECVRPDQTWRPYFRVQQASPTLYDADVIISDDTHALVDQDANALRSEVAAAASGNGRIAAHNKDFPLLVQADAVKVGVPDLISGQTPPRGGTEFSIPASGGNADDDDNLLPWWAVLLLCLALCCCCVLAAIFAWMWYKKKEKAREETVYNEKTVEHHEYVQENPLHRDEYSVASSEPRSASKAEEMRAQELRNEIYVLEEQKRSLHASPSPIYEGEDLASPPARALTHKWGLGDEVEVLYAGQWYPATISSTNCDPDGAWDVDWGDGTGSRFVAACDIRPPGGWSTYGSVERHTTIVR